MGRIFVDRSQNVWDRSMQRRLAPPMASVAVGDLDDDPVHPADAEFTRFNTSDCRLRHTPTPCLQCLPWQQARPDAELCLRPSCRLNVSSNDWTWERNPDIYRAANSGETIMRKAEELAPILDVDGADGVSTGSASNVIKGSRP